MVSGDSDGCLHVFYKNDESRIGECYWKMKRSRWIVCDVSELIPKHGGIVSLLDIESDEGPHLFFASRDGVEKTLEYHHVHWTNDMWVSSFWGSHKGEIQQMEDPPGSPPPIASSSASSSSSSGGPPLPPPPPPAPTQTVATILTVKKTTSAAKPALIVRLPMKEGSHLNKLHKYKPVRLVIISDTHNYPERVGVLPAGDILVHCGDFTVYGKGNELEAFANWLDEQTQYKHKVVIAGNHETNPAKAKTVLQDHCTWLDNKIVTIMGLNFYGTTWGCDYSMLPTKGVDILLTHKPPSGHGDVIFTGESRGSDSLASAVHKMKPILHAFGHNHEGFGATCDAHTVYINAATCMGGAKSTSRRGTIVVDIFPDLKSKYGSSSGQPLSSEDISSSETL
jgi:predicted phosphodiesterase